MMGRGGAEGYVFAATRVLPAEGKVEARGTAGKKRKTEAEKQRRGDTKRGESDV
jgi:tRNA (adenine-N(1)-)-methyltransferase non-catalytic subunit